VQGGAHTRSADIKHYSRLRVVKARQNHLATLVENNTQMLPKRLSFMK
jgi:hypothetical protein